MRAQKFKTGGGYKPWRLLGDREILSGGESKSRNFGRFDQYGAGKKDFEFFRYNHGSLQGRGDF